MMANFPGKKWGTNPIFPAEICARHCGKTWFPAISHVTAVDAAEVMIERTYEYTYLHMLWSVNQAEFIRVDFFCFLFFVFLFSRVP